MSRPNPWEKAWVNWHFVKIRSARGRAKKGVAIEQGTEERYLRMAQGNSGMLCSEAPIEILEACSSEAEPTKFLEDFFAVGYGQWVLDNHGRRLPQEIINNAIIVLWLRACRIHTSILLGEQDPDWGKPFFADLGLYGD